jgi:hypothetical protein
MFSKNLCFIMKKLILAAFMTSIMPDLSAQDSFKKNILYWEILGNGPVLYVSYERQTGTKPGLGWHFGVGLAGDKPAFPMGTKYLFDLGNKKSFLETGLGITLAELKFWDDDYYNQLSDKNPYKPGFIPSAGYRHQTAYGLMWRVNYTPVFTRYQSLPVYGGISLGWKF